MNGRCHQEKWVYGFHENNSNPLTNKAHKEPENDVIIRCWGAKRLYSNFTLKNLVVMAVIPQVSYSRNK